MFKYQDHNLVRLIKHPVICKSWVSCTKIRCGSPCPHTMKARTWLILSTTCSNWYEMVYQLLTLFQVFPLYWLRNRSILSCIIMDNALRRRKNKSNLKIKIKIRHRVQQQVILQWMLSRIWKLIWRSLEVKALTACMWLAGLVILRLPSILFSKSKSNQMYKVKANGQLLR